MARTGCSAQQTQVRHETPEELLAHRVPLTSITLLTASAPVGDIQTLAIQTAHMTRNRVSLHNACIWEDKQQGCSKSRCEDRCSATHW